MRDPHGEPLVVYHGTNQAIPNFCPSRLGKNTNSISSRSGFYFTENPVEAAEYAQLASRKQVSNAIEREQNAERLLGLMDRASSRGDHDGYERFCLELEESEQEAMSGEERGANIMPVFLAVKNPMILDMKDSADLVVMNNAIMEAKARGHDALKMVNVFDPVAERPELFSTTQWVVFNPAQIRSSLDPEFVVQPVQMIAPERKAKVAEDYGIDLSDDNYREEAAGLITSTMSAFGDRHNIVIGMAPHKNGSGQTIGVELTDFFAANPGHGAGTLAINEMVAMCSELEISLVVTPSCVRNKEFYGRFGFEPSKRHPGMLAKHPPVPAHLAWQREPSKARCQGGQLDFGV